MAQMDGWIRQKRSVILRGFPLVNSWGSPVLEPIQPGYTVGRKQECLTAPTPARRSENFYPKQEKEMNETPAIQERRSTAIIKFVVGIICWLVLNLGLYAFAENQYQSRCADSPGIGCPIVFGLIWSTSAIALNIASLLLLSIRGYWWALGGFTSAMYAHVIIVLFMNGFFNFRPESFVLFLIKYLTFQ